MAIIWLNNLLVVGFLIGISYYKMKISMKYEIEKVNEDPNKKAVFNKLQEYPDTDKTFIKKLLVLHMRNQV
jgi:hypothetical protein